MTTLMNIAPGGSPETSGNGVAVAPQAFRGNPSPKAAATGRSVVVESCQICGDRELEPVIFLGYLPPVNAMQPIGAPPAEQPAYPARVLRCPRCTLVQLGLVVDPEVLFPPDYPCTSGTTRILRENFTELAYEVASLYPLSSDDLVVDIGSNDGTLLSNFAARGPVLGIEPTNAGRLAIENGIPTYIAFFNQSTARRVAAEEGRARLVTATNVIAHIEDIHEVVASVLEMLHDDGILVTESHYLKPLVEALQYDTIHHEHLRYYSLHSLQQLFDIHGMEIIHARPIPTHGGSIRAYAARKGVHPVRETVRRMLDEESAALTPAAMCAFAERALDSKLRLCGLLQPIHAAGHRVYGIGAPSRASTLINYVGLDEQLIHCVLEVSGSPKIGRYMPGTLIPVLDEARLFEDQPEYALLFSWHIADELIPKLRAKGYRGRFIIPLPEPRIVEQPDQHMSA